MTSACTLTTPLESPASFTSPARTQRHSGPSFDGPESRRDADVNLKKSAGSDIRGRTTRTVDFVTCMVCRTCEKTCVTAPTYTPESIDAFSTIAPSKGRFSNARDAIRVCASDGV